MRDLRRMGAAALDLCHGVPSRIPLTPIVLPLQIVRLGNVALVAVPGVPALFGLRGRAA